MSIEPSSLSAFPRPQTSMVGRASETAAIHDLLGRPQVRLVTLTGPGGVGKTRLAIHAALTAQGFADGRWFVELAGASDPAHILPSIAQVLGLRERGPDPILDQIVAALDGRDALLVLDNFEHLLGGATVVSQLSSRLAGVKTLATSRSPLRLAHEHLMPIGPLGLNAPIEGTAQSEAVELFLQRARATRPGYDPSAADLQAIRAICAQLSGLPLAIELAAARTRVMAPQALLARLAQSLRILAAGPQDAPARHRSMRDAIEWSYRLLPDDQQALLRAMGVFAGSVPLDGIESMAESSGIAESDETLDLIERLVDASMIEPIDRDEGDPRVLVFPTVREFVTLEMEQAGELEAMRDRHAAWVDALTSRYEPYIFGPQEHLAYTRMRADLDNIRAAIGWSLERGDERRAIRIIGKLWAFWAFGAAGSEGKRWLDRVLPLLPLPTLDRSEEWMLLHCAGMLAWSQGDAPLATRHHGQALSVARALDDPVKQAVSLMWMSQAAWYQGDYQRMRELAQETLAFQDAAPTYAAGALDLIGISSMRLGRLDDAERELRAALREQERYSQSRGVVWTLQLLADLAQQRGDQPAAARAHRESLPLALESANHWAIFEALSGLLLIALGLDRPAEALELLASAELMLTSYAVLPREGTWISDEDRARLKRSVQADDLQRLADQAASLTLAQVVERAVQIARSLESGTDLPVVRRPRNLDSLPTDAFALTAREQDVLALMVQGQTDRQIGDALFISHGTARTHVAHVLQKLDARNRAAAVRKALEHELVA